MVVQSSSHLKECRNSFLRAVGKAVSLTNERTSSHETVADRINDLKVRKSIILASIKFCTCACVCVCVCVHVHVRACVCGDFL